MNKQNKKHKKNTQRGITLIALVITIIILLILAMVSIRLVMNSGIISRAEKGVDEYSKAEADEQAQLLQAEYEMAKYEGKATGSFTDYVLETKYNGVQIGDYVNYTEAGEAYTADTNKGVGRSVRATSSKYDITAGDPYEIEDLGWRVLGVNSKGELELISDNPTADTIYLANEEGYFYGPDELNRMCNTLYGKGKHAIGARSLNVDDINNLIDTGYDPKTYSNNNTGAYGDIWTYRFPTSGSNYVQYRQTKANGEIIKDWQNTSYQTFRMPVETNTISSTNKDDDGISLESTYYEYDIANNITNSTISAMITKGTGTSNISQWFASRCITGSFAGAYFGVRYMQGGKVSGGFPASYALYISYGGVGSSSISCRIRPIVCLNSNIQIEKTETNDGSTLEKACEIK